MPVTVEKEMKQRALEKLSNAFMLFAVGIFILSPFLQLVLRFIDQDNPNWRDPESPLLLNHDYARAVYQEMMKAVNIAACFAAQFFYVCLVMRFLQRRKELGDVFKARWKRFIPVMLMLLFAAAILAVTLIRGATVYDLEGHPYMNESIYSYILYVICYFFCGVMIWNNKFKRVLLYILVLTSVPVNAVAHIQEWMGGVSFVSGERIDGIFHNSNHYAYYLALVTIASLLLFVYEEKFLLKFLNAVCAFFAITILIPNDTFGAFLAVLFVLIAFTVYCIIRDRKHLVGALVALGIFLGCTALMSIWYNTVISSFFQLTRDVQSIAANPSEAGNAGTTRWRLWTGTVEHMKESPWLGFGVEGLLTKYDIGTPHNELLQYAEAFGIPTTLLYFASVVSIFVIILRHNRKFSKETLICFCMAVCYFVSSMVGVAIYYTTPFFYILLGMTYAEYLHGVPAPHEKSAENTASDKK
ncbi:MAG: O-antigen ligase family protein [Oscillospiraceae bacterium]|nr:O-antigen ligase family protein [Oscillospiraceae bacterium]